MIIDFEFAPDFVTEASCSGLVWVDPRPTISGSDYDPPEVVWPAVWALADGNYALGYRSGYGFKRLEELEGCAVAELTVAKFEARRFARFMVGGVI